MAQERYCGAESIKMGLGLISMRERVRLVGGTFSVRSRPFEGTRIEVQVPLALPGSESEREGER